MTTYPISPDGNATLQIPFPYWVATIGIKDHNGHEITEGTIRGNSGTPTLQFLITSGGNSAFNLPKLDGDEDGPSTVAAPTNTALLAALKSWAENQDWNTGYDWSNTYTSAGATVTPVSFDSINITEVTGTEFTASDITPA